MDTNRHESIPSLTEPFVFLRVHSWFKNFDLHRGHSWFLAKQNGLR
ncbi:MAG: hypothetical protein ACI8P0_002421 [Planctomycetaceae bacterium]|jgi:hypothetical protein